MSKQLLIQVILLLNCCINAYIIKRECLEKHRVLTGMSNPDSVAFDWYEEVLRDFNTDSVPVLKRSCFNDVGDLNSFRIIMKGYDESSNVMSDSAGPSELGTCENKRAPIEEHPSNGKIWYNADRVQGVEFSYKSSTKKFLIGKAEGTSWDMDFNNTASFIGFYGMQSEDRIYQLGFLVTDVKCSEYDPLEE